MNKGRFRLLSKLAGRIRTEQFSTQISQIINLISNFVETKQHWDLKGNKMLGSVNFDLKEPLTLDVIVFNDPGVNVVAGIDWPKVIGVNPKLLVNLYSFRFAPSYKIYEVIKPYIVHEVTHLLDLAQQPVANQFMDVNEDKSEFWKELLQLTSLVSNVDWSKQETLSRPLEDIASIELRKIVRLPQFRELLVKYNLQLDEKLYGKMLKFIIDTLTEDALFNSMTGGDPFGLSPKEKTKKVQESGYQAYYNSKLEVRAYINQIIEEVENYLTNEKSDLIVEIIKGKKKLSDHIEQLLIHSPTYKQILPYFKPENLNQLYTELYKVFSTKYNKLSLQDKAKKFGINLSPRDEFVYRYLDKLMDSDPEKFKATLKNEKFVKTNINAINFLREMLEFWDKLNSLKSSINEIMKE